MDLLDALGDWCARLSADQHKPQRKAIADFIYGIAASRSVMISEVARALDEGNAIGSTFRRLSRNLNTDRLDDEALHGAYLRTVAELTARDDGEGVVVAVDYSDLAKPFARPDKPRGMEGVCACFDGSKGKKGWGLPMVEIEASLPSGVSLPLVAKPFSYRTADFRSQGKTFLDEMANVAPYVGPRAWWTADRGFDSSRHYFGLDKLGCRWVNRLQISTPDKRNQSERHLFAVDGKRYGVFDLACQTVDRYPLASKSKSGRNLKLRIGARKVWLTDQKREPSPKGPARTLIVVWGYGKAPICLLASEHLTGRVAIIQAVEAYARRWSVEVAIRAQKDSRGWGLRLEDVRALKLRGVNRLCLFATAVYGFLAFVQEARRLASDQLADAALAASRSFRCNTPDTAVYRLLRGVSLLLARTTRRRRRRWRTGRRRAKTRRWLPDVHDLSALHREP